MRPLRLRIVFELILGAVVVASLVVILRLARRISEYQRRHEADTQSLRLLREALGQKGQHNAPTGVIEEAPAENDQAAIASREATIARLDRELAEAQATVTNLQSQLSAANDQSTQAQASAQEALQKQQADSQAQLDDLQKKLDAALTQSDIARNRVAALEADNAKLTAQTAAAGSQANDVARVLASLQDLDRRREGYLTSILRRYRDISSDFRAMSSMLDTSHDPNRDSNAGACGGAVLSRIQNAVSSAEDDLRQISDLNARTQKLAKQLPKK
jgi:chromosome segregation ATPase